MYTQIQKPYQNPSPRSDSYPKKLDKLKPVVIFCFKYGHKVADLVDRISCPILLQLSAGQILN